MQWSEQDENLVNAFRLFAAAFAALAAALSEDDEFITPSKPRFEGDEN